MPSDTYRTQWGADTVEVTADWAEASDAIEGLPGRQVADFRHYPLDALRHALLIEARAEGISDEESAPLIDQAMRCVETIECMERDG